MDPHGDCESDPCFYGLANAIYESPEGSVIQLNGGTYYEDLVIDKNVTVEIGCDAGSQDCTVILEGP